MPLPSPSRSRRLRFFCSLRCNAASRPSITHSLRTRSTVAVPTPNTFAMSASRRPPPSRLISASNRMCARLRRSFDPVPPSTRSRRDNRSSGSPQRPRPHDKTSDRSDSWFLPHTFYPTPEVGDPNLSYGPAQTHGIFLLVCQATLSYQDTSKQHVCGFKHQYNDVGILDRLAEHGVKTVIPPKKNRTLPRTFDRDTYRERHRIENFFCKIKEFRAIATRYDNTASSFAAGIHLVAGIIAAR